MRGEQSPDSDVDLLVEFAPGEKTFDAFMQLSFLLEELLEHPVEFDYFGVDYEIVWDVVQNKIPQLYQQIRDI